MGTLSYSSSSYSILHKQKHSPPLQLLRLNYPTVRINVNSTASSSTSSTSNYSQMSRKVIHAMITAGSRRHRSIKNGVSSSKLHNEQRCLSDNMNEAAAVEEEHFDILTKSGKKTGITKPRSVVHRDGDYHRAVHVWVFAESTQQLLLQKRADCKDSWAGLWDISCAGHISAGDSSLVTARRELQEELGIKLPNDAFELLFVFLQESVINGGKFINNEYNDVYLVTTKDPIPLEAFTLEEFEVSAVKYISVEEYRSLLANEDPRYVYRDVDGKYGQLFEILSERYS